MAIILKANKVNLFVSTVLFVFWYHSPIILDTPSMTKMYFGMVQPWKFSVRNWTPRRESNQSPHLCKARKSTFGLKMEAAVLPEDFDGFVSNRAVLDTIMLN
jgi:hypothetical protein